MAEASGRDWLPDALIRARNTATQDGRDREGRFRNLDAAIRVNPRRSAQVMGRAVLLVDDVMTSGATFSAAAQALIAGGAGPVRVIALARVARDV
jgi:predicted amidophosphoribosyltransferase